MKRIVLSLCAAAAVILAGCKQEPVPAEPEDPGTETPEDPGTPVDPNAPGIRTVEDFMAFAKAVNEGSSTEQWQNEEGWVNLLADLDFSGVTDYVPVGFVTALWTSYKPVGA